MAKARENPNARFRPVDRDKVVLYMDSQRLAAALQVMIFDTKIRDFLDTNDPQAVKQAQEALRAAGYAGEADSHFDDPKVSAAELAKHPCCAYERSQK